MHLKVTIGESFRGWPSMLKPNVTGTADQFKMVQPLFEGIQKIREGLKGYAESEF